MTLEEQIQIGKIISNSNRLQILKYLFEATQEVCVYQISQKVGISQSLASHQLAYLSARGVVEGYRVGQTMCYKIVNSKYAHVLSHVVKILSE